jgi:glycosyltransferase involved in cell wall biosynthesis
MLVTVIIPTYNSGLLLAKALDSILKQTHTELDIIVIDDGSTDDSDISCTSDPRVRYAGLSPNQGKSVAMNMGLDLALGTYFALQDADDISLPERIAVQVEHLEKHPNLAGVYVTSIWEWPNGAVEKDRYRAPMSPERCKFFLSRGSSVGHDPCVMYRTDIAKKYPYDPDLRIGQGVDVNLRIGEEHAVEVLKADLYIYRPRPTGTVRSDMGRTTDDYIKVEQKRMARRRNRHDLG